MRLTETDVARIDTLSATTTIDVRSASALILTVTASSSLVVAVTVSYNGESGTFVTYPVTNKKTGATDADGAAVSFSANDVWVLDTQAATHVKVTFSSGSGTVLAKKWFGDPRSGLGTTVVVNPVGNGVTNTYVLSDGSVEDLVSASARKLYGVQAGHINDTPLYVKLYDKATAPDENDTPIFVMLVPCNSTAGNGAGSNISFPNPIALSNGLGVRLVEGIANNNDTQFDANEAVVNLQWGV